MNLSVYHLNNKKTHRINKTNNKLGPNAITRIFNMFDDPMEESLSSLFV